MTFLSPWWLLLLLPVIALAVAYVIAQRRRSRYAVRFATLPMLAKVAPASPGWRRHAPAAALLAAFLVLAVAAARPEAEVRVPHERATVMIAVDVSRSMDATDVEPTRIAAARDAASAFVEELPDTFNVGVVAFAGDAMVMATPTTDRDAVVRELQSLTLRDSTAIGEAVFTSLDQIAAMAREPVEPGSGSAPGSGATPGSNATPGPGGDGQGGAVPGDTTQSVPGRIVLLSDGSNVRGRSLESAAAAARDAGVPVSTIAYGTPTGVIEIGNRVIPVPADTDSLAQLAQDSGGQAYEAASGDELSQVYEDIGSSIGWRTEPRELTPYLTAAALLIALAAAAMSLRWFARLP